MKKTAYIITILANIILLAYAVVPHHHHKFQVCVISEHCHTNDFDESENHQHDSQTKSDNCLLTQAVVLPQTNNSKEDQCFRTDNGIDVFLDTKQEQSSNYSPIALIQRFIPAPPFLLSSHINNSLGLRAPPAI